MVDGCHNLQHITLSNGQASGKGVTFAMYSLFPPGLYYSDPKVGDGVHVTEDWDMDSLLRSPRYTKGKVHWKDVPWDPRLMVIIEILQIKPAPPDLIQPIKTVGWAVCPVFMDDYVAGGHFQLPLFEGPVRIGLLQSMHDSDQSLSKVLAQELDPKFQRQHRRSKKQPTAPIPLQLAEYASVFVRLIDGQRVNTWRQSVDVSSFDQRMLETLHPKGGRRDGKIKNKYRFNPKTASKGALFGLGKKPKTWKALLAKREQPMVFKRKLLGQMLFQTGLHQ